MRSAASRVRALHLQRNDPEQAATTTEKAVHPLVGGTRNLPLLLFVAHSDNPTTVSRSRLFYSLVAPAHGG